MKRDARYKPQDPGGKQAVFLPSRFPFPCLFRPHGNSPSARHFGFRQRLYLYSSQIFLPLYYTRPPLNCQSAFCISFSSPSPPLLWIMCEETLGLCPKPCKGLLERSPLTARTLTQLDFGFCFYVIQILGVAVFRAANSGCYEPNPVKRDWGGGNLLPCLLSATG